MLLGLGMGRALQVQAGRVFMKFICMSVGRKGEDEEESEGCLRAKSTAWKIQMKPVTNLINHGAGAD